MLREEREREKEAKAAYANVRCQLFLPARDTIKYIFHPCHNRKEKIDIQNKKEPGVYVGAPREQKRRKDSVPFKYLLAPFLSPSSEGHFFYYTYMH